MESIPAEIAHHSPSSVKNVVPTALLRDRIRNYTLAHREEQRASVTDALRFGLGEIKAKIEELDNLNAKDVSGLAARIKRRKHASVEDMYRLSHAFLQNIDNIRAFALIPGATQVLVKELTGHDYPHQLGAAECLCNFALGEPAVCEKIALLAGSYLVTYLDSGDARLKRSCLWTLANLLATEGKAAPILSHMALIPKLWLLYTSEQKVGEDYQADAGVCLYLIASRARELLSEADIAFITEHLLEKKETSPGSEYFLQLIWHCDIVSMERALSLEHLQYLIFFALYNLTETLHFDTLAQRLRIVYSVRLLANLLATADTSCQYLYDMLENNFNMKLSNLLSRLFQFNNEALNAEVAWMLKNVFENRDQQLRSDEVREQLVASLNF